MLNVLCSMNARVSYQRVELQSRTLGMCTSAHKFPRQHWPSSAVGQEQPLCTCALAVCHSSAFLCVTLRTECEVYS